MKPTGKLLRVLAVAIAAGLLTACGGGEETNGPGDPPTNPPASPPASPPTNPPANPPATSQPTLATSATELNVTVLTSDAAVTRTIALSVVNLAEQAQIYSAGSYSTAGIDIATLDWQGTDGTLAVRFKDPGALEPGVYRDTITFGACPGSPCAHALQGSPRTIPVTYTVIAAPTAVAFSPASLTIQGNNIAWHAPIEDQSIGFTIAHPTSRLWERTTVSGNGAVLTNASVDWTAWPSRTQGVLDLTLRPPSTLGAGTYTDSIKVEICLNAQCSRQASGSPAIIPVTYQVTGSAIPTITVQWSKGFLTGAELITSETRSPMLTLTLIPSQAVHDGVYARHTSSTTGLITSVVETQVARGSQSNTTHGKYDIFLKPPATLGSGTFTDTMEFEACFDVACTVPVPNSKYSLAVQVVITAAEGTDFTRRIVPSTSGATDVAWSQANQLLYVSSSLGAAHRIIQVDPVTMAVTPGPLLGAENLNHLAVTPDGSYLYAGSRNRPFVHRLPLPALSVDLSVSLGNFNASTPYLVSDLATLPGQPQSFVVAVGRSGSHGGVFVYDDSTVRPVSVGQNPAQTFESARWLVPAAAGTFLSQSFGPSLPKVNTMDLLTVDANGISTTSSSPTGHEFFYSEPQRVGTKMFTLDGKILDAGTGSIVGTLPGSGSAYASQADEAHGLLFVWTEQNQREVILIYDTTTLQQLANVPVYANAGSQGLPSRRSIALWGSNGLALTDGNQLILLSGPIFTN